MWADETTPSVPTVFSVDLAVGGSMPQPIATLPVGYTPPGEWALTADKKAIFHVASDGVYTTAIP